MSEEEKDILVTKRKYWTKLMKYNLVGTIIVPFILIVVRMLIHVEVGIFPDALDNTIILVLTVAIVIGGPLALVITWSLSLIMYGYYGYQIYKITKPKVLEQRQRQHEASKDLTLDSSTTSVSSAVGTTSQETRKEIGNVLGSLESEIVFKIGVVLMTIYALFILFIDHPYAACRDSNIEELADCVNLANLLFKGLSFMGAIGLILSLIGIYTKPPV
jgi:hypothetical protein